MKFRGNNVHFDNTGMASLQKDWRYATTDKNEEFPTFLHYNEPDISERTVFGAAKDGLFYNYSDRLGGDKWHEGLRLAKEQGKKPKTAAYFEVALNHFHSSTDVDLQHVILGVNRSNGFSYLIFGYTYTTSRQQP